MDLQVSNQIGRIEWNIDEIRKNVTEYISGFKNLVVTEDNLKDMEKSQKVLATIRRQVDKFRKTTKAEYEKPLKVFEMEIKSIQDIIADAELPLSDQLKKYELERVNAERVRLAETAKEIAISIGLRDEYLFYFSVPEAWTNRTAKKGAVAKEMQERLEQILQQQNLEDEQKEMDALRQQQIEMLCQTTSDLFGLNTPITAQDCAYATKHCELKDLPQAIKTVAQKRADVEQRMMETVAPVVAPVSPDAPAQRIFDVTISIKNLPESRLAYLKEQLRDIRYELSETEVH
ncbi:MAG: DUF1351 domain-containing protein [Selenomonadaceae bacterium]